MALDTTKHDVNRTTTGIKLPSDVLDEVWQSTIAASFVMNHARRMSIPGTGTNVNIITGDPTPGWVTESTEKPVSTPTFSNKVMTPYKIAVIVPFSNEFRRDVPTLYDAIAKRVPAVLAKTFDETVFFGTAPGTGFDTLASVDGVDLEAAPADAINGAMTDIMGAPRAETVLAVCHGSATLQFKLAWEPLARCPQDVHLSNCCVLVYDYDPEARTFACERIVNQSV